MSMFEDALSLVAGAHVEIIIFLLAFVAHTVVFGHHSLGGRSRKGSALQKGLPAKSRPRSPPPSPAPRAPPAVAPGAVKTLQGLIRSGAAKECLIQELSRLVSKTTPEGRAEVLSSLLNQLGKAATAELVVSTKSVAEEFGVLPDCRLYEALLHAYLSHGLRGEFDELLQEVEAKEYLPKHSVAVLALRATLVEGDLDDALCHLPSVADMWRSEASSPPSAVHSRLFQQLARLAIQASALPQLCEQLHHHQLFLPWTIEALLTECPRHGLEVRQVVEELASKENIVYTKGVHVALVRSACNGVEALQAFEAAKCAGADGRRLLLAGAAAAAEHGDKPLAEAVVRSLCSNPDKGMVVPVLHLCVSGGPLAGSDPDASVLQFYNTHLGGKELVGDLAADRIIIDAALRRGDLELLQRMLTSADSVSQVALLKSLASEKRLEDVFRLFEVCPEKSTALYNTLLDACVDTLNFTAAGRVMRWVTDAKMADIVTYNTMVKAHLQNGNPRLARSTVESMVAAGFAPNCMTFNALIDATVREHGGDVWSLVEEMRSYGLKPNHVTCSILLKSIHRASRVSDVEKVMAVLADMEEAMDEVLLSSVCEACIRSGCSELLIQQLNKQRTICTQVKGAHTYGSIIRAYGFVKDIEGVWNTWAEMKARHVVPTSVTLGCMVEAMASNGDPEAGYTLVREFMDNPQRRPLVNAVIYCSILKGLSHLKRFDRMWEIYREMKAENLQFSIVTYNALIDGCSRSGDMGRIPALLEEMASVKIEPNIITYSTVIKGYCQVDCVDKAFELLRDMKKCQGLHPDEVTYNTLLDGCARYGKWEQGLALLEEMREAAVPPSNFTLSVLVKLANRSKHPEEAFQLTEDLCAEFNIRLNVHVFNNLIHVCTAMNDLPRAFRLLERMVQEKVRTDPRTYLLLLRGCIRAKMPEEAAGFLRAAGRLPGAHWILKTNPHLAQPKGGLPVDTVSEAIEGIARTCKAEVLAMELLRDLRDVPGVPLDPRLPMRLASRDRNRHCVDSARARH